MATKITGTREWAARNANCLLGCSHGCRYCYSRHNSVVRFGSIQTEDWTKPALNPKALLKRWTYAPGVVMFPSQHDILPEFIEPCIEFLRHILAPGNKALIVSKPHWACINRLTNDLSIYRERAMLRFTIGAFDDAILNSWEPGAPTYEERLRCLIMAKARGWRTSVSVEPMLDTGRVRDLARKVEPFVTGTIWIGCMNKPAARAVLRNERDLVELKRVIAEQSPGRLAQVYHELKDNPKIRWKDSMKAAMNLPRQLSEGEDW